jgi:hypothetical protein
VQTVVGDSHRAFFVIETPMQMSESPAIPLSCCLQSDLLDQPLYCCFGAQEDGHRGSVMGLQGSRCAIGGPRRGSASRTHPRTRVRCARLEQTV